MKRLSCDSQFLSLLHDLVSVPTETDLIVMNFGKSFDKVPHRRMKYGIRGIAHDWLDSYLYNRRQFVSFNNHCSDMNEITCGVPKDPYLDPCYFCYM